MIRETRRQSRMKFYRRAVGLLLLMAAVAYSAWIAPWAKPVRSVEIVSSDDRP